jgi:pyruvate kinase
MALYWGVTPLAGTVSTDIDALFGHVTAWGLAAGRLSKGDRIVFVAGVGFGTGGHNMALVKEV